MPRPLMVRAFGCIVGAIIALHGVLACAQSIAPSAAPSSAPVAPTPLIDDVVVAPAAPTPPVPPVVTPARNGSLRIETISTLRYEIELETPAGAYHCAAPVGAGTPCILRDLPLGPARVRLRDIAPIEREVVIGDTESLVRITRTPSANGVFPGLVLMVLGVALGAGAVGLKITCDMPGACGSLGWEGYGIPMAFIAVPTAALGVWLATWRRHAQSGLELPPAVTARAHHVEWSAGAAAYAGGGAMTVRIAF